LEWLSHYLVAEILEDAHDESDPSDDNNSTIACGGSGAVRFVLADIEEGFSSLLWRVVIELIMDSLYSPSSLLTAWKRDRILLLLLPVLDPFCPSFDLL
jgi:hypothetical protein